MRLSAALYTPQPWLACLKSAQLQRIARATGIHSSGTKGLLVDRIATELALQSQSLAPVTGVVNSSAESNATSNQDQQVDQRSSGIRFKSLSGHNPAENKNAQTRLAKQDANQPWSILSIDMGIQNLAFAHLRVSRSNSPVEIDTVHPSALELTAWHRLAVSEISTLNLTPESGNSGVTQAEPDSVSTSGPITPESERESPSKATDTSFSPDLYARNAYTLITSLLTAYRPTHVLIERQRFRSGGSSAVLEWTLRVGVLEGMLYAVLQTLRQERGGEIAELVVKGIEPRRVVRYWLEGGSVQKGDVDEEGKKGKRLTAREVKKAKIDLVGRWVDAAMRDADVSKGMQPGAAEGAKIVLADKAECPVVHGVADAYLRKWRGETLSKKGKKSPASKKGSPSASSVPGAPDAVPVDPGKLDDLADCLLQGVTWVEWQIMRERIAREGATALDSMPV